MTTWKVLLALPVLALPVGYVVADVGAGADDPAPRPALVLPVDASSERSRDPGAPAPDRQPSHEPAEDLCDDDRAEVGRDADDDDDAIDVIRPCPDDLGDDADGDDRDNDDGDDG